ncbi:TIGR02147 family protein [Bdellovibrio sp. HCB288]|uniref:TIGR02147 family protein n=1 Tax=Bdellovibrio sp. HCB288 TaxID=3394355 RepID=UPI0039B3C1DD
MKVKPLLLNYIDYRLFLQDWYSYNKEHKKGFSYGTWTLQCGFKSRSFIRLVMLGQRNLGVDSISQVARSLHLNASESEYFEHLVLYTHADTIQLKEYHFAQIVRLNKGNIGAEIRNIYKFLSNPKTPRAHLLLSLDTVICTLDFIAETMQISKGEALEILENIEDCGLASFDETTDSWKSSHKDLQISNQVSHEAIRAFHLKSLKEAEQSLTLPASERSFSALLMTMTEEEYKEIQQDIEQFQNILIKKYNSKNPAGSRIYQMNLNIIPTTSKIITTGLETPTSQTRKENKELEIQL